MNAYAVIALDLFSLSSSLSQSTEGGSLVGFPARKGTKILHLSPLPR